MKAQTLSSRWLVGAAAVITALVVASLSVALLRNSGEAILFSEGTPKGIVQRYLQAIEKDDLQTAYSYIAAELTNECTYQHFRGSTQWLHPQDMRAILESTEPLNGGVEVSVRITRFSVSPPISSSESSHTQRFILEQKGGAWRFTKPPWPMSFCPDLEPGDVRPVR